ncbi:FAD binding domain-containing protein [Penicillium brasilianum]|uniref:FAD binding domain-containing protein n=1 Tax=Penicillium brasilianum TaxID=104259 RepID=A0A1S9RPR6_PENBI|nr:FAD binding domain-containing protein [Penicillium brasilianum]
MTVTTTLSLIAPPEHRHEPSPFDPAVDIKDAPSIITALNAADPSLKVYTRSSPNFETLRGVYNKLITHQPLAICRPQTIEQIQLIVRTARAANPPVPIVPRCGGHDVYGRGLKPDSLSIDMRELDTQTLAEDRQSVRIGGGVTSQNFVGFLDEHGLCTANGTAGNVGWTGWAVWGGYGPFNDYVGLGVDNILSARLVLADGSLVEAGPGSELLWGVRGAGGSLGVIVDVTVKVYPMPVILAGFIAYQWGESAKVLSGLQELLDRGIPDTMCLQMGFMKTKWGVGMSLIFAWPDSETLDEGRTWLETVRGLGAIQVDTVGEMDEPVNVCTRSASVPRFTPETIALLQKYSEAIPDGRQYNVIAHIGHGKSTRPNPDTSFATREPHVLFHINACDEPERMDEARSWVDGLMKEMNATRQAMKPVYVSFMGEDEDPRVSFGSHWERLQALKQSVDPDNVFRFP